MRLLLISLVTVAVVVVSLMIVRGHSLEAHYEPFDAPFLLGAQPYAAVRVRLPDDIRAAILLKSDVILWLDLRLTSDDRWLVIPAGDPVALTHGDAYPLYTLAELRPLVPTAMLLEDVMAQFSSQRVILNVLDNVPEIHLKLTKTLAPFAPDKRVLVQSDTEVILDSVKSLNPRWLYGTGRPDIMRLLSFDSIWMVASAPFKGDVYISPLKLGGRDIIDPGVLAEIKRRRKEVFLGPLTSEADGARARDLKPDGFIFDNVDLLRKSWR